MKMHIRFEFSFLLFILPGLAVAAVAENCDPELAPRADGPQVSDERFAPRVESPAYEAGTGPTVAIDEAHQNFHTMEGRYATFARVLQGDGFVVKPMTERFSEDSLRGIDVLVVANPLHQDDVGAGSSLPVRSAYTEDEIDAVEHWVSDGGSLLLIADHMPFPGAAVRLAHSFGIIMTNSFATDESCRKDEFLFQRTDHTLASHPITDGRNDGERVDYVRSFTGQALWLIVPGKPILRLPPRSVVLLPIRPWHFSKETPRISGDGLLQGAAISHGRGRVAVFGEAAMFSAQVSGPQRRPMGMNMQSADRNPQFLLNVMHWLVGLLPES